MGMFHMALVVADELLPSNVVAAGLHGKGATKANDMDDITWHDTTREVDIIDTNV